MTDEKRQRFHSFLHAIAVAFLFALSHEQLPLYSGNQCAYFIHGLGTGGMPYIANDWMAGTADLFPVFSFGVATVYRFFPEWCFYLVHGLLMGVYIVGLLLIGCRAFGIRFGSVRYWALAAILGLFHSQGLSIVWGRLPEVLGVFHQGVAQQYALGAVLQPSAFGVFLILSIALFTRGRPFFAVATGCVAALVHPSYLWIMGLLTAVYIAVFLYETRDLKKAVLLGLLGLILVLPVAIYTAITFRSTSPEAARAAQSILVDYRVPHHAKPSEWFGLSTIVRLVMIGIAVWAARRTRLFAVLLIGALVAILLTGIQIATGSRSLALFFPWRVSVVLVPIATTVLLGWGLSSIRVPRTSSPSTSAFLKRLCILVTVLLAVVGIWGTRVVFSTFDQLEASAMERFVRKNVGRNDLYLIPLAPDTFRLNTGAPVFVDHKAHPFRDAEIVTWYDRIRETSRFYQSRRGEDLCVILDTMVRRHGITHVVVPLALDLPTCSRFREIYRDPSFVVYAIAR